LHDYPGSLAQYPTGEIKIGSGAEEEDGFLLESIHRLVAFAAYRSENSITQTDETELRLYRFGVQQRDGFGYRGNDASLLPVTQNSMLLYSVDPDEYRSPYAVAIEDPILRFGDRLLLGISTESGIAVQLCQLVSFTLSYERGLAYPRFLVRKHLGSSAIEYAGIEMLQEFIDTLRDASPAVAPVMSILLKSSWSYGICELRRQDMNWSFRSYAPLVIDHVKIGFAVPFSTTNRLQQRVGNQLRTGYRIYQNDMSLYEFDIPGNRRIRLENIRKWVL